VHRQHAARRQQPVHHREDAFECSLDKAN
jgi:hypothetical protein